MTISESQIKGLIAVCLTLAIIPFFNLFNSLFISYKAPVFTDLTFTVSKKEMKEAQKIVNTTAKAVGAKKVEVDDDVAKVSIIGVGMVSHSGVAAKMFKTMANESINIMMISTSEIKISCIIKRKYTELAVTALHDAFGLEKKK